VANRQAPASRYFAVLLAIIAGLYALVFFTGSSRTPQLGLDLRGGTTVTLTARTPGGSAPSQADLELARQIIDQRVNGLGVAGAEVVTQGSANIVISVPGKNGERARELGATAQLRFRPVIEAAAAAPAASSASASPGGASASGSGASASGSGASASGSAASGSAASASSTAASSSAAPTSAATPTAAASGATATASGGAIAEPSAPKPGSPFLTQAQAAATYATLTCAKNSLTGDVYRPKDYVASCSDDGTIKYLLGPTIIEGTQVTDASASTDQTSGAWVVLLDLNSSAQNTWAKYTAAHNVTVDQTQNQVAFTLDGRVLSAPSIQSTINGQTTTISGSFNQKSATTLANQLKYGALPLTFSQATAQTISTELGSAQLRDGLIAGAIGIVLVFVYALIYYRLLGLVMIASLGISALVVYGSLVLLGRQLGLSLSLAGIAGFIVAIGITADSFVVYFERLKDEIREGRTLRSAVPRAWVRARRTILSADAVSFLAAAILYLLAIGDVKGFAFTLGLSTVLDLVVVFLFTHPLMAVLSRYKSFGGSRFSGLGQVDRRRPAPATGAQQDRELVGAGPGRPGTQNRSRP
jgi:preprotein translocase subunit SecD